MPRYAHPSNPLPPSAERALDVLGINAIRGAVIRELHEHPKGKTSGEIQRSIGANYQTVLRHLRELERSGIVTSDAGEDRQGQRVIYQLDRKELDRALRSLSSFLRGGKR